MPEVSAPKTVPRYAFDSLDEREVSDVAFRGRPTVLCFATTGSFGSQAQMRVLADVHARENERVHVAVVALEPREQRELVELYRKSLKLPFPVALADAATLAQEGTFGEVSRVPTILVLDAEGEVRFRRDGQLVSGVELSEVLRSVRSRRRP